MLKLSEMKSGAHNFPSDCDRDAFKKDEEGDTRCCEMVPSGILCIADGYALRNRINTF